jgi:hypothetical protein
MAAGSRASRRAAGAEDRAANTTEERDGDMNHHTIADVCRTIEHLFLRRIEVLLTEPDKLSSDRLAECFKRLVDSVSELTEAVRQIAENEHLETLETGIQF